MGNGAEAQTTRVGKSINTKLDRRATVEMIFARLDEGESGILTRVSDSLGGNFRE
jgi:hypothetical protein